MDLLRRLANPCSRFRKVGKSTGSVGPSPAAHPARPTAPHAAKLYGREEVILEVVAPGPALRIVHGDSGIGKSAVLRAAARSWPRATLAAGPVALGRSQGSALTAICEALAEALAEWQSAKLSSSRDVQASLAEITGKAEDEATERLLTFVLERMRAYGLDPRDLVPRAAYGRGPLPGTKNLDEELMRLTTPPTARTLAQLTDRMSEALEMQIGIALDMGERLCDEDVALLADLNEQASHRVAFIVAVSTHAPRGREVCRALREAGAAEHELLPLGDHAASSWLKSRGVARSKWEAVRRASNDYPLFFADAIQLVLAGTPLASKAYEGRFAALQDAVWRNLDPELQRVSAKLVGFEDSPDDAFVAGLLDYPEDEVPSLRRRLEEAGLFVWHPHGDLWFHDRKRNHIREQVLSRKERESTATASLKRLRDLVESGDGFPRWAASAIASCLREIDARENSPRVSSLIGLRRDDLALLAALIELVDRDAEFKQFAEAREVVRHARRRFGLRSPARPRIEALESMGLIHVASNEHLAILAPLIESKFYWAALIGVISHEFSIDPVPRLVRTVFDSTVRMHVPHFKVGTFHLGHGSLLDLKRSWEELMRSEDAPSRPGATAGVGGVVKAEDFEVGFVLSFSDEDKAEQAKATLRRIDLDPDGFAMSSVWSLPPSRIGIGFIGTVLDEQLRDEVATTLASFSSLRSRIAEVDRLENLLRSHLTDVEASSIRASGTVRRMPVERSDQRSSVIVELQSEAHSERPDAAEQDRVLRSYKAGDPLFEVTLRDEGLVSDSERFDSVHEWFGGSPSTTDLIEDVVSSFEEEARRFNRGLRAVELPMDIQVLGDLATSNREREMRLARDIANHFRLAEPVPYSTLVWLHTHASTRASERMLVASHIDYKSATPMVEFLVGQYPVALGKDEDDDERLASLGIPPRATWKRHGQSFGSYALAELLGFNTEDVRIYTRHLLGPASTDELQQ